MTGIRTLFAGNAKAHGGHALHLLVMAAVLVGSPSLRAQDDAPVTVQDTDKAYVLTNSYVIAAINKRTGDLESLRYHGLELMGHSSGHPAGYWEQDPSAAAQLIDAVTIDPATNGGERAEVSVKGISQGRELGAGAPGGGTRCNIELRYSLGRHDSGIYTYAIYTHPSDYPNDQVGESRFGAKLNPQVFDWMTINARVNKLMPTPQDWVNGTELNMKEARLLTTGRYRGQVEHKYDYSAVQFDTPAYGWSSTSAHVGFWFVNPSMEYLSGGPTKVELTGHLDLSDSPDPTLLDYWRGTHYGGSYCPIARGESWTKVVGPIFVYCNSGSDPQAMWHDALRQAGVESGRWPYAWVKGVDYPAASQRGDVAGAMRIEDPQAPNFRPTSMLVGLAAPDYPATGFRGSQVTVDWQSDAKHYEFWARADAEGRFDLRNVRPGTYVLHAIAGGVLGEFALGGVVVRPGERLDLGALIWRPVRYGRQLWDIGVPNRSAREFAHGSDYNHWGLYLQYPKWFPHGVDFVVGRSDYRKDWNFEQVPRVSGEGDKGNARGESTTWSIHFDLPSAPQGRATLRLALCGVGTRYLRVTVNGKQAGLLSDLRYNAVINRDGIQGYWSEHDVPFDAAWLKAGRNQIQLTIPAGNPMNGIEYDYLRLELADEAPAPPMAPARRETLALDSGWRFRKQEAPGAPAALFDDSSWRTVNVPHDWAIEGPFDPNNPSGGAGAFLPGGVGWYRKTFTLPDASAARRVFLEFDGVMANSDVWLNGEFLGDRPYGYSSFGYELTGHLRPPGQPNELTVRVDDSRQPASRWYPGAGIYRHVRLVVTAALHLEKWGTVVTTPAVAATQASVVVRSTVVNESDHDEVARLDVRLRSPEGASAVEGTSAPMAVPARGRAELSVNLTVAQPERWNLDHPALYHADVQVEAGAEATVVDDETVPFGIREARFDAATGFWLNGVNLKLKGVCLHADGSAFGAAVPLDVWRLRLEALRAIGANAIRTAHNPPAPEFLDLCDRMGFLVMDEAFDCWTVGKNPYDYHLYFSDWSAADARDLVRRDRNHPSVVLWSAGNEIHDTPHADLAKRILGELIAVFHQEDPTRPVTQALLRPNVSHDYDDGLADMLDVIGTNYRYNELLAAHAAKPSRKIIGTENIHDLASWLAVRDHPAYSGEFIWSGIDYLGESHGWPNVAAGAGLLDRTAYPHPDGVIFQSWWSDRPMVYVARRVAPTPRGPTDPGYGPKPPPGLDLRRRQALFADWTPRDSAPHEEKVEVYSNCAEVELILNGHSLGAQTRSVDLSPRIWTVPYTPGTLEAIGRQGGSGAPAASNTVRTILRTAGPAAMIRLTTDRNQLSPGWDSLALVTAEVVDASGTAIPGARDQVAFGVSGPGAIAAVDSADNASHESFQGNERRCFQGRCVAYVRALKDSGRLVVTASAAGLRGASATIEIGSNDE